MEFLEILIFLAIYSVVDVLSFLLLFLVVNTLREDKVLDDLRDFLGDENEKPVWLIHCYDVLFLATAPILVLWYVLRCDRGAEFLVNILKRTKKSPLSLDSPITTSRVITLEANELHRDIWKTMIGSANSTESHATVLPVSTIQLFDGTQSGKFWKLKTAQCCNGCGRKGYIAILLTNPLNDKMTWVRIRLEPPDAWGSYGIGINVGLCAILGAGIGSLIELRRASYFCGQCFEETHIPAPIVRAFMED